MLREVVAVYGIWRQAFPLTTGIDMKNPPTHEAALIDLDWEEDLYLVL